MAGAALRLAGQGMTGLASAPAALPGRRRRTKLRHRDGVSRSSATGSGSSPGPDRASARWTARTARARRGRDCRAREGKRRGGADIGLQAVGEEKRTPPPADVSERPSLEPVADIPGHAAVDESVELVAAQISKVRFLIEAQFRRTRQTVIAADLGAAIAAAERDAAEIELLRGEQRAGRRLAGGRRASATRHPTASDSA